MLRTAVTSIVAWAQPHWLVSPGHAYKSRNLCVMATDCIDSHVGMSGSGGATGVEADALALSAPAPVKAGTIAAAEIAFMKSLRLNLSILLSLLDLDPHRCTFIGPQWNRKRINL